MMFVTPLAQAQSQAAAGYSLKVLFDFNSTDGARPYYQRPIMDAAGNIYGTTEMGGAYGVGTVFMVGVNGNETVLRSFSGPDGIFPTGPLLRDASGNLYGTTFFGGNQSACQGSGCGVVFKVDTKGNFTVLYAFTGTKGDGATASPGLIRDSAGNLYGATLDGGTGTCIYNSFGGCGTVFKLTPKSNKWTETVLYNFTGAQGDGAEPFITKTTNLSGGYIYGDTYAGGDYSGICTGGPNYGCGVVWKLDPTTRKETILHRFNANHGDGLEGFGTGLIDARGNLYGTTSYGGVQSCPNGGCGILYRIDSRGKYTVLHKFMGAPTDVYLPAVPLIQDKNGNLYGGGSGGGKGPVDSSRGGFFEMVTSDQQHFKENVLFTFTSDGMEPEDPSGIFLDAKGNLYGFTYGGGPVDYGTVVELIKR